MSGACRSECPLLNTAFRAVGFWRFPCMSGASELRPTIVVPFFFGNKKKVAGDPARFFAQSPATHYPFQEVGLFPPYPFVAFKFLVCKNVTACFFQTAKSTSVLARLNFIRIIGLTWYWAFNPEFETSGKILARATVVDFNAFKYHCHLPPLILRYFLFPWL